MAKLNDNALVNDFAYAVARFILTPLGSNSETLEDSKLRMLRAEILKRMGKVDVARIVTFFMLEFHIEMSQPAFEKLCNNAILRSHLEGKSE